MLHNKHRPLIIIGATLIAGGIVGSGHVHALSRYGADTDIVRVDAGNGALPELLLQVQDSYAAWQYSGIGGPDLGSSA
jgi:hypothetical protein